MIAETLLATLLASLRPTLVPGEWVFVSVPRDSPVPAECAATVLEAEGRTLVLPRLKADQLGLEYDFVAAWITLEVRSSLEAVGLTAEVSKVLAEARISCNVLAGLHHDHLLVSVADAARAVETLQELSARHAQVPLSPIRLRAEEAADRPAILALVSEAFALAPATGLPVEGEPQEAAMLRQLWEHSAYLPGFSLVAESAGKVVGYVISTRGSADGLDLLALGPLAVAPRLQRHGVGSALVHESIHRANAAGERGIALRGDPGFYQRFGFVSAASLGVESPDPGWKEHFQLLPLALWPGGVHGAFTYAHQQERF